MNYYWSQYVQFKNISKGTTRCRNFRDIRALDVFKNRGYKNHRHQKNYEQITHAWEDINQTFYRELINDCFNQDPTDAIPQTKSFS